MGYSGCYNHRYRLSGFWKVTRERAMDATVSFGTWLKQQRKARGLTQKEFANRVGCTDAHIRKIESGERRPSDQIALLLANQLEIRVDDRPVFLMFAIGGLNSQEYQRLLG